VVGSLAGVALALYRKYRPAKFAEVVGQEHVTEPLSTALDAGRINHAYLFSGPRGCGKTSSARILARSLNCELGPTPEPCGVCSSCISLAPGGPGNIDVTELDAASHGGVDDTRELRDRAFFAPAESRYRVFIVDEAHMITTQGFNALLKIVEEPPEHLVFVFATTEPDKVLPTIRSRTHHYPFRLIPPGTLRKLLERICAEEGAVVAPAVYPLVIRAGGGSARDSLSVLDQLLAGAGPEGVTYERAVTLLGVTDVSLIDDVVDALAAGDRGAVFEAVDRMVEAGHDPRRFAADLLQRLRDLTLLQAVPEAPARGLVDAADDEIVRMVEQADRLGPGTLVRYGEIVHSGLIEMRGATAPRLLLELLCARMLLPAATVAEPGLLERLERLERRNAIAAAPLTAADTVAEPAEQPADGRRTFARASVRGPEPGGVSPQPVAGPAGDAATVDDGAGRELARPDAVDRSDDDPGSTAGSPPAGRGRTQPDARPATQPPRDGSARPAADAPAQGSTDRSGAGSSPERGTAEPRSGIQESARPEPSAPTPGAADSGTQGAPTPATGLDAAAVRRVWPEILAAAKERKKRTAALLVSATVRAIEGDTLVLSIGTAPLARLLSEQSNTEVIAEALHAVLGVRWRIRCEHGEPDGSGAAPTTARGSVASAAPPSPPRRTPRPPPTRRSAAPDDGEPLPPEPPDEDAPPDDEEAMIAEAAAAATTVPERRDPEEAAIELLSAQLGARALDRS